MRIKDKPSLRGYHIAMVSSAIFGQRWAESLTKYSSSFLSGTWNKMKSCQITISTGIWKCGPKLFKLQSVFHRLAIEKPPYGHTLIVQVYAESLFHRFLLFQCAFKVWSNTKKRNLKNRDSTPPCKSSAKQEALRSCSEDRRKSFPHPSRPHDSSHWEGPK